MKVNEEEVKTADKLEINKDMHYSRSSISLGSIHEENSKKSSIQQRQQHTGKTSNNINKRFTKIYSATPPLTRRATNKHFNTFKFDAKTRRSYSTSNLQVKDEETTTKGKRGGSLRSSNISLSPLKTSTSFSSFCSDKHQGCIQHSALNIQGVMTWVSFILPALKDNSDTVILVIPGNPGAVEFYDRFIEQLYQDCGLPIFGISHAGTSFECLLHISFTSFVR